MAFVYLYVHVCLSALVLALSIQACDGFKDEVTQDKKTTEFGRSIVRRQVEENNVTTCQSFENANFTEPKACQFEGEEFPLCEPGKRKIGKCIKDRDDYCVPCQAGETFMSNNNNCTSCTPCKTCAQDEQIAVACTLFDDTQCEPRPTTAVDTVGLTTSQQEVTTAPSSSRTSASVSIKNNQQDATTPVKYKDLDPPVFLSTENPDCKCNCTNGGIIGESSECSKYLIFYIVCIILLILLIVIVLLLVCGTRKYKKLEKENKTLKQKLEQNGNCSTVTKEKSNGDSSNHQGYKKIPDEDIEMIVRSKPPEDSDNNRNQNGNTSQVDVIDEKADDSLIGSDEDGLEPPYAQVGNEQTQADKSINDSSALATPKQSPLPKLPVSKIDNNESIPVMTEEEEKDTSALESLDPDYDRADPPADRRSMSVRGRIESTPTSDPPPLPVRNKALQRSQTFNSPFDSTTSPSINVKADVHASKDVKTEEPSENQPFLSRLGIVDSDVNSENSPAIISTLKRFLPATMSMRKRSKDTEEDGKAGDETATNPSDTSTINIEDLYAKVDKSRKRNPNPESADSSEEPETSSIFQKVNFQKLRKNSAANGDSKPAPTSTSVSGGNAPLDKVASDLDFEKLTRNLMANILYSLYSQLGLNESTVERIETESNSTMISVLQEWRNRKGKRATRKAIVQALRKGGHNKSAIDVQEIFSSDAGNLPESCV